MVLSFAYKQLLIVLLLFKVLLRLSRIFPCLFPCICMPCARCVHTFQMVIQGCDQLTIQEVASGSFVGLVACSVRRSCRQAVRWGSEGESCQWIWRRRSMQPCCATTVTASVCALNRVRTAVMQLYRQELAPAHFQGHLWLKTLIAAAESCQWPAHCGVHLLHVAY